MLLLKRHLVELVRLGKKRQTVRLWSRPMVKAGGLSYTPGLGRMRIVSVEELSGLGALTEADALADGFGSLKELLGEIRKIYGARLPAGKRVYRVKFEWPVEGEVGVSQGKAEKGGSGGRVEKGKVVVKERARRERLRDYIVARMGG